MWLRSAALAVVGFALVVGGCSDDMSRPTAPRSPQVLASLTQSEWTHWTQELCPPSDLRGDCLDYFNEIKDAEDQQAAALELFVLMLEAYEAGTLQLPTPPRCGENNLAYELVCYLHAVAEHYGVDSPFPDFDHLDLEQEHVLTVLSGEDFTDDDELCVPTNAGQGTVGNAVGCFKASALKNLPAIFAIFAVDDEEGYVFPMPLGFIPSGKVYNFFLGTDVDPESEGVTALLCVPPGHLRNYLFRDAHDGKVAEKKEAHPHEYSDCPEHHASLLRGDGLLARGVNAAGSFIMSALSPKRAYANHNLAHGGLGAYSHWQIGAQELAYDVQIVRVIPPATHTPTSATFKQSGSFVIWLEVLRNGTRLACLDLNLTDVRARATGTPSSGGASAASAWISANRCELTGGVPAWVVEIPNPLNNQRSSGVIDVQIEGVDAEPRLTYNATL